MALAFSTIAQNQLQAIQMSMMFFLPNMMLSGFLFPFAGMPVWAQWVSEFLPLTHYVRIVRSIMLKGAGLDIIWPQLVSLAIYSTVVLGLASLRLRRQWH